MNESKIDREEHQRFLDECAMRAMQIFLASDEKKTSYRDKRGFDKIADLSYDIAKSMLAERERKR